MSFPAADHDSHPRGSGKGKHLFDDMHSFIAAMAKRFPIHVAVIAGHPAMIATGPLGRLAIETVIASRDPIAADVVGARLLGFRPQGVRHLWGSRPARARQHEPRRHPRPLLGLDEAIRSFAERAYGRAMSFEHA